MAQASSSTEGPQRDRQPAREHPTSRCTQAPGCKSVVIEGCLLKASRAPSGAALGAGSREGGRPATEATHSPGSRMWRRSKIAGVVRSCQSRSERIWCRRRVGRSQRACPDGARLLRGRYTELVQPASQLGSIRGQTDEINLH